MSHTPDIRADRRAKRRPPSRVHSLSMGELRRLVLAFALAAGAAAAPVLALPVTQIEVADLMPMAPALKQQLQLSANQQILWQQVEAKTRAILDARQARRDRLQATTRRRLDSASVELRDLAAGLEADTAASAAAAFGRLAHQGAGQTRTVSRSILAAIQAPENPSRRSRGGRRDGCVS